MNKGIVRGYAARPGVSDEGTSIRQRDVLDFTGYGVTVTDDPANARTRALVPGSAPAPAIAGYIGPYSSGYYGGSFTDYQTMKLCRIVVPPGVTSFDQARIECNATVAGTVRIGVYTESPTLLRPRDLVADWGTVSTFVVGFPLVYSLTIAWSPVPGTYWLAVAAQSGGAGSQPISEATALPLDHLNLGSFPTVKVGQESSVVSGALPSSYSLAGATNQDRWPLILLRRSA